MLASLLLVTAAFALTRRPVAAFPALLAGVVLYAGMYTQSSLPVMYASIAVGYLAWAALVLGCAVEGTHAGRDHRGRTPLDPGRGILIDRLVPPRTAPCSARCHDEAIGSILTSGHFQVSPSKPGRDPPRACVIAVTG